MNRIPLHLHQTWKSKDDLIQGGRFYNNVKSWFEGNQGLEYSFYNDEEMYSFVKEYYPEHYELFLSLPLMVEKTDLFRYFILYKYGGVYSDIDTYCIKPIKKWTEEPCSILLSMETKKEDITKEYSIHAREYTVCQWTLASISNHPFFELLIKRCIQRIQTWPLEKTNFLNRPKYIRKAMETVERTGPGLFTDVFFEWCARKKYFKKGVIGRAI